METLRKKEVRKNTILAILYILLLIPLTFIVHSGYSDQVNQKQNFFLTPLIFKTMSDRQ